MQKVNFSIFFEYLQVVIASYLLVTKSESLQEMLMRNVWLYTWCASYQYILQVDVGQAGRHMHDHARNMALGTVRGMKA